MIEIIDRIPLYPGRVKLTPVAGQENTYDMVRADEPIEPGTPINRALFKAFIDEMNAIRQQVNDSLFEISNRVRLGDLVEGAVFGLYENGVLVPFIKVQNNYSTTNRIMVVRKDCVTEDYLTNPGETTFSDSRCDRWLNNEYKSRLDSATQGVVTYVTLLSLYEYYMKSSYGIPQEGSNIPYFHG